MSLIRLSLLAAATMLSSYSVLTGHRHEAYAPPAGAVPSYVRSPVMAAEAEPAPEPVREIALAPTQD